MRVVMYPPLADVRLEAIRAAFPDVEVIDALDDAAAIEATREADAFFGVITPEILAGARRLRWVQSPLAGLDAYMFEALERHPAILTNMRGIHARPIAEHVMGYVTAFARNLHRYVRLQAQHSWAPIGREMGPYELGRVTALDRANRDLAGATIGIVGFGEIGQAVGRRAAAFEMEVLAVDARPTVAASELAEVQPPTELARVLGRSDYVVVTLPLTPASTGLFDRDRFEQMRSSAIFINVGRGPVVVLDDLVNALLEVRLAGAGLDVFDVEPLPADHRLWAMEQVIVTPHVAGYAPSVAARHLQVFLDNLARFQAGEPLLNVVDKGAWY